MRITYLPRVEKEICKLPKTDQIIIINRIRSLEVGLAISQIKKLSGYSNIYRIRIGNYRVVFSRLKDRIVIILIAHRKHIYNLLKRIF